METPDTINVNIFFLFIASLPSEKWPLLRRLSSRKQKPFYVQVQAKKLTFKTKPVICPLKGLRNVQRQKLLTGHDVIRPDSRKKSISCSYLLISCLFVHVLKRNSYEFSFHTMCYETWGYKTHNSFHNTSYGMKIHFRHYMYVIN